LDDAAILANRKLERVFIDKDGKFYPLDEVDSVELAKGLKQISKETAKRLYYKKNKDNIHIFSGNSFTNKKMGRKNGALIKYQ
jgi:hypothetical protein